MRRARELIYMYTEHGDVTKPRKTLVRTRAFSGENSPPMKFTFLGTSHFFYRLGMVGWGGGGNILGDHLVFRGNVGESVIANRVSRGAI